MTRAAVLFCFFLAFSAAWKSQSKGADYCNQVVFDTTVASLCEPHGRCVNEDGQARCLCDAGYFGRICDHKSEEDFYCSVEIFGQMVANRCKHGSCIGSHQETHCKCQPDYSGTHCDVKQEQDFCAMNFMEVVPSSQCYLTGSCRNQAHGATCACFPNFQGTTCASRIDPNLSSSVAIIGGLNLETASGLFDTEIYVPDDSSHNTRFPDLSIGRMHHSAVKLDNDTVAIVAGHDAYGKNRESRVIMFNLKNSTWTRAEDTEHGHSSGAAALIQGDLVVCGGLTDLNSIEASCERFVNASEWMGVAFMSRGRHSTAAVQFEGQLCMVAGMSESDNIYRNVQLPEKSVECWDPEFDQWSPLPDLAIGRSEHAATVYENTIVTCGGNKCNKFQSDMNNTRCVLNECERYFPHLNQWMPMAPMKFERRGLSLITFNGKLMAFGGSGGVEDVAWDKTMKSVEVYNEAADLWSQIADLNEPRVFSAAVLLN